MKGNESQAKAATYRSLPPNGAFRLLLNHYLNSYYRQQGSDRKVFMYFRSFVNLQGKMTHGILFSLTVETQKQFAVIFVKQFSSQLPRWIANFLVLAESSVLLTPWHIWNG
jgi:hypothetical protein